MAWLHMLPRLLRITSKVYLYDTSAPGLLDTGLLRLLRRVRSCGQCAFALYTVPRRRTDHALILHYAAESVRLRHGCPQNTNNISIYRGGPPPPPRLFRTSQINTKNKHPELRNKSMPGESTEPSASHAPAPPARMRRTSCVAGLPECLCLQQPPRRHALLRHRHLDLGFKVSRDSKTL